MPKIININAHPSNLVRRKTLARLMHSRQILRKMKIMMKNGNNKERNGESEDMKPDKKWRQV